MTIKEIRKIYAKYSAKEKKEIWGLIKIIESKKLTDKEKMKYLREKL
tara:strand:+ start:90 stop:230 length:141 start_codon:yes stop_codon:yes gene_type:complete